MTYQELLNALNKFDVSVLTPEQLKTFKEALQIKASCVSYYLKVAHGHKELGGK